MRPRPIPPMGKLVDELNLLIGPMVLGNGVPALRQGLRAPLRGG